MRVPEKVCTPRRVLTTVALVAAVSLTLSAAAPAAGDPPGDRPSASPTPAMATAAVQDGAVRAGTGNLEQGRKRYRWITRKHSSSSALQVVWGACGLFTSSRKVVRIYDRPHGQANTLRCGPRFTSTPRWGYRHIKWRHQGDFETQAAGTVQNWRDVADLAMAENSLWPTTRLLQSNGRWCSSAQLWKVDLRTGEVKKKKYFHLITEADGNVWTAYPARKGCRPK